MRTRRIISLQALYPFQYSSLPHLPVAICLRVRVWMYVYALYLLHSFIVFGSTRGSPPGSPAGIIIAPMHVNTTQFYADKLLSFSFLAKIVMKVCGVQANTRAPAEDPRTRPSATLFLVDSSLLL